MRYNLAHAIILSIFVPPGPAPPAQAYVVQRHNPDIHPDRPNRRAGRDQRPREADHGQDETRRRRAPLMLDGAQATSGTRRLRIGLAVSGGADSTALLVLMAGLRDQLRFDPFVLHVDHGLRPDSAADAAFVRGLAASFGIPFHATRAHVKRQRRESLEMAARRVRLDFFAKMTTRLRLDAIATGHHADDVAETFIMRLARGSGPAGLAGLKRISRVHGITFIRPLLDIRDEALRRFLRDRGVAWREDSTNADVSILRNKVRHVVLPWLRTNLDPRITEHLCKSAAILRGDLTRNDTGTDPNDTGTVPAPNDGGTVPAPQFTLEVAPSTGFERRSQSIGELPAVCELSRSALAGRTLALRTRLPGDRIAPTGMGGRSRKLQDVFVTAKVPPNVRDTLPVLADADTGEILWVPGYRVAESAAVATPESPSWRLTLLLARQGPSAPST